MYLAKITIKTRPSILDPQGRAIGHALASLGLGQVVDARMGKFIELKIDAGTPPAAEEVAREACKKLLANPVMEDFSFSIEKI